MTYTKIKTIDNEIAMDAIEFEFNHFWDRSGPIEIFLAYNRLHDLAMILKGNIDRLCTELKDWENYASTEKPTFEIDMEEFRAIKKLIEQSNHKIHDGLRKRIDLQNNNRIKESGI